MKTKLVVNSELDVFGLEDVEIRLVGNAMVRLAGNAGGLKAYLRRPQLNNVLIDCRKQTLGWPPLTIGYCDYPQIDSVEVFHGGGPVFIKSVWNLQANRLRVLGTRESNMPAVVVENMTHRVTESDDPQRIDYPNNDLLFEGLTIERCASLPLLVRDTIGMRIASGKLHGSEGGRAGYDNNEGLIRLHNCPRFHIGGAVMLTQSEEPAVQIEDKPTSTKTSLSGEPMLAPNCKIGLQIRTSGTQERERLPDVDWFVPRYNSGQPKFDGKAYGIKET